MSLTAIRMFQTRLPRNFAFSARLPSRWRLACGQPLIVMIVAVALAQVFPVGGHQSDALRLRVAAGNADVAAAWKFAMEVGPPAVPGCQFQQIRLDSLKKLDVGVASSANTRFTIALGRSRDGGTTVNSASSNSLVALHVRIQI